MDTSLQNVKRAYTGKPGCMCGCRGKYSDGGTRSAKIIYNKIMNNPNKIIDEEHGFAYIETDTRNLVVYFVE